MLHLSALAVVASAGSVLFNSDSAAMINDSDPSDRAARIARVLRPLDRKAMSMAQAESAGKLLDLDESKVMNAPTPASEYLSTRTSPIVASTNPTECDRATLAFGILISPFSTRLPAASVFDSARYVDSLSTSGH